MVECKSQMGMKRSAVIVGVLLIFIAEIARGFTNPEDVTAINSLFVSLGSPVLPSWIANGGDPCTENWQGVSCNYTSITSIIVNGANLRGELGSNLGTFSSIKMLDLSNNLISGSIPSTLPVTLQHFFLSDNQLTGSIPSSLSSLTLLLDMSLNHNSLTGEIPDSFEALTGLINLDLSNNNLSGQLPPSLKNLSSLTTLHLQNNYISGTLAVLEDLPLRDLNIESNLFAGPIPDKLQNIPNFQKNGNPFNTTIAPVPPPASQLTPSLATPPHSVQIPKNHADQPSASEETNTGKSKNFFTTKRVVWISVAGVLSFVILGLALVLLMPRRSRQKQGRDRITKQPETGAYKGSRGNPADNELSVQSFNLVEKAPREAVVGPKEHQVDARGIGAISKLQNVQPTNVQGPSLVPSEGNHEMDMNSLNMICLPPPPPPPPPPPASSSPPSTVPRDEKVDVQPIASTQMRPFTKTPNPETSVKSYSIAALQLYTKSFSQENFIGEGMLGSVYRAELPDGKLLAVKKLDRTVSTPLKDDEFIDMVNSIDRVRHANVVELMGYCSEHGERLLIYEYCSNGSLQDALHSDDEFKKQLSWNVRVRIALGIARALWYLHEFCDPPVVHRNITSVNVLLDDELSAHVSDCGLATLVSSKPSSQLSGRLSVYGYGAPEFESGTYTHQSDVYSFGVVMLELLTGRKSHDSTLNRGEQFLARWAIHQLHDIDLLLRMVDPSLDGQYPAKSLSNYADIISRCLQPEPEFRPAMSDVVEDLTDMLRKEHPKK